ncbi:MAG: response regulator [Thermoanaerobaculia bacterium]
MTDNLRVLIVEDNPADAELLELELLRGGYAARTFRVQSATEMEAALDSQEWDLILSDYSMPRFSGMSALELLKATGKDIPFILISGSADDDMAVDAMRAGAHDFFGKGSLKLLIPAIQRELREAGRRATARAQREQLHQNEKLAALGTLLAGVAHELNNPLGLIMHQAAILEKVLQNDSQQERIKTILQAAESCSHIVKNFLALARHEPPRRVPVSLNEVVRAAMDLLSYGLRVDKVDVKLDLTEALPAISGDPQQLERVVINLVSNAQYSLRTRPVPRVLTLGSTIDAAGEHVLLYITDNGGGIPPEIRSRIFDPFFTTKPTGEGTGLGLSLCHGIITAHNGTITVSSEVGAGTIFAISLPIDRTVKPVTNDTLALTPTASSLRILVVDDNPDVAMAFSEILSIQGHDVHIADTSRGALQMIGTGVYDIIVSDMRMPDLDGPAFYREVTTRYPQFERSFLFVTGDIFNADTDRFLKESGAVCLAKPCTFEDVENAVALVVRLRTCALVREGT